MKNPTPSTIVMAAILFAASTPPANAEDTFVESAKLLPSDGAPWDIFGGSTAISGTTAIVGARWNDDNGEKSGSAYLFDTDTGAELATLLPSDGEADDNFGWSVAISGTTAIVGVPDDSDNGLWSGSAYLFDISNPQAPVQTSKLLPSDGEEFVFFGQAVAIHGTTALIGAYGDDDDGFGGASGSAYLFDISNPAAPVEIAKLFPSDSTSSTSTYFGWSVAISGNTAIIGAHTNSGNGDAAGAAYLFDISDASAPVETAKLLASDGEPYTYFGISVAISGNTAIVGAYGDNDNGTESGSAYLFDVSNLSTPVETAKLLASDGSEGDYFGSSVAISGNSAIVGAHYKDNGLSTGAAYLFDATTGVQVKKLQASDATLGFGISVAISGNSVIVGASWDSENGIMSGSAYLFDVASSPPGAPYCFGDGTGTTCPCGNTGGPGEGCANSTGVGAKLAAVSTNSIADGEFALWTSGLPAGPGLYFQGDNKTNSGQGVIFGDGLRCVGGNIVRLEIRPSTSGLSRTTVQIAAAGGVAAGDTKHYQLWYRDANNSPCGSGFNLSNGYKVLWMP